MSEKHLFIFGLGYISTTLAKELLAKGWRVSGTCRSASKGDALKPLGITPYIFDTDLPLDGVWDFSSVTHVLHSVPPTENGDPVFVHHLQDLQNLPELQWFGYLSTTGVYGDHGGEWVDENTPVNPFNDRSRWRAEAEAAWLGSGLPAHIFRLSGIYGPGSSAIDDVKNGTARRINKPGQVFSRIHVEDIAQILEASMARPNAGSIYNCADDFPAPQAEVVEYAAKLLGVEPPPLIDFDKADLSPMARSFYACNRRVSNKKMKEELGVTLKYKDYISGLEGIFRDAIL
jgi:nucleoside-diphosphate-sugar epimerase